MASIDIDYAMALGPTETGNAQSTLAAIDIALEPKQVMVGDAQIANAALPTDYPTSFAFGDAASARFYLRRLVPAADLPKVFTAAGGDLRCGTREADGLPDKGLTTRACIIWGSRPAYYWGWVTSII